MTECLQVKKPVSCVDFLVEEGYLLPSNTCTSLGRVTTYEYWDTVNVTNVTLSRTFTTA